MKKKRNVGLLLFDEVEVLDFAGPFEVFSVTAGSGEERPFEVKTISETGEAVTARNGLTVVPDFSIGNAPHFDILIVPGGPGARNREVYNERLTGWIKKEAGHTELLLSVCTGALLLAKTGLLNGKSATTHWASYDRLEQEFPEVNVVRGVKFVDEGNIVTSGGISAGINMSFHIIKRLLGEETARQTAKRMEYDSPFGT
ncbi:MULTISPECIES: DJ-1/PfpI family protein [Bacillus]|uniref:DJ-1/PfpI family protein n=1 Tax=Bacillus glycinifermentans TaxID=1664069 RepID=A0AAJ3Z2J2_9BACI|nr:MULTISPECIES: DJ-1/PfpI family protein [Bacillus]KKB72746.1 AraC family transcriptional regulator [Bacillus sp. TH008]MBU8785747.1 DJ-1/PfpI family protein [Bacillus glycinifermentans]MDU0073428.1 DJ-1/PfpI family protein [Bacillus sp. IG6]MED8021282.1 DJ-1/PfpI family protein [Bacillus glycinifermentans]NUJ16273.1 DJ-1/PfpI family protein [Bacillus glycinifermentans]